MTNQKQARVLIGAFIVVIVVGAGGYFLASGTGSAPQVPPDRAGTAENLPAGPATKADQATTGSVSPQK
jgi:hypothetical protein